MFSVNRLVGRTVEREITDLRLPRLPPLPRSAPCTPSYPLVPAPPGPPVPVQLDKFNLACLVKTQSTPRQWSDERRISHQREYSRFDGHFDPGESGPLDVPRGTRPAPVPRGAGSVWRMG